MYAFYLNKTHESFNTYTLIYHIQKHFPNATSNTLAVQGLGEAHRPPSGRGPMIIYARNANFFLLLKFKPKFNRNMAITCLLLLQPSTLSMIFYKVHPPP